ncbi:MAG: MFS transporter [bacterium]|nr:MFS transporter [bacterium]
MLAHLFPQSLREIGAYFLVSVLSVIIFVPKITKKFDQTNRIKNITLGITLELIGILGITFLVLSLDHSSEITYLTLGMIILLGASAKVGASLLDISISADWIPTIFKKGTLGGVNSQVRRIDLIAEVTGPVMAGFVMTYTWGFFLIATLNITTFIIEFIFLKSIYHSELALQEAHLKNKAFPSNHKSEFGLSVLLRQYSAPLIFANACLWFTVLTPHGPLLTTYLKNSLAVSESSLGIFQGLGALFGVLPTFYYMSLSRYFGKEKFAALSLSLQLACLAIAFYVLTTNPSLTIFYAAILLSRAGLYGFVLAETEIRQESVSENERSYVAGISSSLKHSTNVLLYIFTIFLYQLNDFYYLALGSLVSVGIACGLSWLMVRKSNKGQSAY